MDQLKYATAIQVLKEQRELDKRDKNDLCEKIKVLSQELEELKKNNLKKQSQNMKEAQDV